MYVVTYKYVLDKKETLELESMFLLTVYCIMYVSVSVRKIQVSSKYSSVIQSKKENHFNYQTNQSKIYIVLFRCT